MTLSGIRFDRIIASLAFSCVLGGVSDLALAVDIPVSLTGDKEVPAVKSAAWGQGLITVAPDGAIAGSVRTSGLVGISAQVHDGDVDDRGPVVVSLQKTGDTWAIPPGTRLTQAQLANLRAGKLYINVHSTSHKDGEIRGQLVYPGQP